jgi:hypothetical protein
MLNSFFSPKENEGRKELLFVILVHPTWIPARQKNFFLSGRRINQEIKDFV